MRFQMIGFRTTDSGNPNRGSIWAVQDCCHSAQLSVQPLAPNLNRRRVLVLPASCDRRDADRRRSGGTLLCSSSAGPDGMAYHWQIDAA